MNAAQDELDLWATNARDAGIERAYGRDPIWNEKALEELRRLARSGLEFSAEDIRDRVGDPDSSGSLGGLFQRARHAGLIEFVGYRRARRIQRHAGVIGIWRGRS